MPEFRLEPDQINDLMSCLKAWSDTAFATARGHVRA